MTLDTDRVVIRFVVLMTAMVTTLACSPLATRKTSFYANPYALQIIDPTTLDDKKLIYARHHYEPSRFTTPKDNPQYPYPGDIPTGELDISTETHIPAKQKDYTTLHILQPEFETGH